MTTVAIVHDYLTQRGGAERVLLSLSRAFPGAPIYTSLYEPSTTFPEFANLEVRTLPLNRVGLLRRHHRLALPLLAPAFSRTSVDADLVLCSTSGWAHGVHTEGRKLVYCYNPPRWLYQSDQYLDRNTAAARVALSLLRRPLLHWDRRAALSADRYIADSTAVRNRIRDAYGIDAAVILPPTRLTPKGERRELSAVASGHLLCVARLLPYKNVDAAVNAMRELPDQRLVVVGSGPDEARLRALAPANVRFVGTVTDAEMRGLYASCVALVAPSYEDFGLTPLEAAGFGRPTVALRFGGFLDTVREGETGVFVDEPTPSAVADGIRRALVHDWDKQRLRAHATAFSEERFIAAIRAEAEALTR